MKYVIAGGSGVCGASKLIWSGLEITNEIWLSRGQVAQKCTCPNVFVLVQIYWPPIKLNYQLILQNLSWGQCLLNLHVPHHFYLSRTIGQSVFSNPDGWSSTKGV